MIQVPRQLFHVILNRRLHWIHRTQLCKKHLIFCLFIAFPLFYLLNSLNCWLLINCELKNVNLTLVTNYMPTNKSKYGNITNGEVLDDNFFPIADPEDLDGNLCDQNQTNLILDTLITAVQLSRTWRVLYKTKQDRFKSIQQHFDNKMQPFFNSLRPFKFESNGKPRYFVEFKQDNPPCFMILIGKSTL